MLSYKASIEDCDYCTSPDVNRGSTAVMTTSISYSTLTVMGSLANTLGALRSPLIQQGRLLLQVTINLLVISDMCSTPILTNQIIIS